MAGAPGCTLRKTFANPVPPGSEPVKPELEQLLGMARLPPARDGGHGDPLGPVQRPGLDSCQAGMPYWAGIFQMDSSLALPELD